MCWTSCQSREVDFSGVVPFDVTTAVPYSPSVIRTFADRETERVWREEGSRRLPARMQQRALHKLALLHRAARLADLRVPPGNRLESLCGDREGQHSIRINNQWCVCFRWRTGDAYDVEICDYH
jgi:proteic killer suppression protein